MERIDLKSCTMEETEALVLSMGEKKFRAGQLYRWIHQKLASDFSEMTNLPASFREALREKCSLTVLKKAEVLVSKIDGTRKYLFELEDGNVIESVWMRYHHGNSVCVSSQAGCRMGCRFCASTLDGLARNLRASEILEQVYQIQKDTGERVSNIVVMGSGEPMDNYEETVRFLRLVSSPEGLNISQRNITVSTCGLVPQMERFAEEGLSVTLALSLHAPNDEVRRELMPVAKKYRLKEVLSACRNYFEKTGRRVTFEYSLVSGINDNQKEAEALAALLSGFPGHVNLIPVNPIKEREFRQSSRRNIENFKKHLEKCGINVTIRREMGRDINGACGQLRKHYMEREI